MSPITVSAPHETYSFDSDAWSNLVESTDSQTTCALATARRLTASREMVVLATVPLLIELQNFREHESGLHEKARGELLAMAGGRLLLATDERIRRERQLGRGLTSSERVYSSEVTFELLAQLENNSDIGPDIKGSFDVEQQLVRGAVRSLFDKAAKRRLLEGWQQDLHEDIAEACREESSVSASAPVSHPHAVAPSLWHLR